MMDGFTMLPRCRRCNGAFYPNPDYSRWDHNYCDDCWKIARARMYILEGQRMVCPEPAAFVDVTQS